MIQTFDDFLLVPTYSEAERGEVSTYSTFFDRVLEVPVISSPMDSITGTEMLSAMYYAGGFGVHHRYCSEETILHAAKNEFGAFAISPSMGIDFVKKLKDEYAPERLIVVIDVAHGNTKKNLDFCESVSKLGHVDVVSGNIVTKNAAISYFNAGSTYYRVGVGSGSVCSTRLVTGCGYPQALAIQNIYEFSSTCGAKIISDGGHKTTGDIVKALALGADFVMLGGMLSGTDEANIPTEYRGMASANALESAGKSSFVEGISKQVGSKGPVKNILDNIKDAIIQACYYTGCKNIAGLRNVERVILNESAMKESYFRSL